MGESLQNLCSASLSFQSMTSEANKSDRLEVISFTLLFKLFTSSTSPTPLLAKLSPLVTLTQRGLLSFKHEPRSQPRGATLGRSFSGVAGAGADHGDLRGPRGVTPLLRAAVVVRVPGDRSLSADGGPASGWSGSWLPPFCYLFVFFFKNLPTVVNGFFIWERNCITCFLRCVWREVWWEKSTHTQENRKNAKFGIMLFGDIWRCCPTSGATGDCREATCF